MSEKQTAYAHANKLTAYNKISEAYQHNTRQGLCDNADPSKRDQNRDLVKRDCSYSKFFDQRIKELRKQGHLNRKVGTNQVRLIDMILSAPAFDKLESNPLFDPKRFAELSKEWAIRNFGEQNIAGMHLHMDESAPHIHLVFVPITDDYRLCAQDIIGGRDKLMRIQDSYAKAVESLGLHRGEKKSAAKHIDLKEYHDAVAKTRIASLPEPEQNEPLGIYFMRANLAFKDAKSQDLDELNQMKYKYEKAMTKVRQLEAAVLPENAKKENERLKKEIEKLEKQNAESAAKIDEMQKAIDLLKKDLALWNSIKSAVLNITTPNEKE